MPAKLDDAIARMKAIEPELDDSRLRRLAMEAFASIGHEVSRDGQVYNPAEGAYRPAAAKVVPRTDRNVRTLGNGRGRRY